MKKESPTDHIMQEDLEQLAAGGFPREQLVGSTVFVTGATGLIGSHIVKALAAANRICGSDIRIIAFARSKDKAQKVFGDLLERNDIQLEIGDVNKPIAFDGKVDFIVHGASPTSSRYFVTNPVETIVTALAGTRHILDFAKEKRIRGMVYLSSLEVYGTPAQDHGPVREQDYGYLDPLSVRSSYSEGKRMTECLCASYCKEYGVPVKIARLSQTFGTGVEYHDGRVFAEFARCAIEGRDIVLHTQGNTVRSYCYTKDAVSALLYILTRGEAGEAYNVTNMDTAISVRDMAKLVAERVAGGKIKVVFDLPKDLDSYGYNPEMVIRLDAAKLAGLGWHPTVGLEEMYVRMTESSFSNREDAAV